MKLFMIIGLALTLLACGGYDIEVEKPVNNSPTISGVAASSVAEGEEYSFTPEAKDEDGDRLSFRITNLPVWADFDNTTGELRGVPAYDHAGHYSGIIIEVSDGKESAALSPFSIEVKDVIASASRKVVYVESKEDFPNPERGFYRPSSTYASPYSGLDAATLRGYRDLHKPYAANYEIYSTLLYRYFFLSDFVNGPISNEFLDNMADDFAALREAGLKSIVRFAYTETVNSEGCDSWICPPYGDVAKERVLEHIEQLKPVLQANKDVIAVVQQGFIGVWGEGYYTDYFGDASQSPYILTEKNWRDRNEVLTALLDAVPQERQVQVRYPQAKQRLVYGIDAPTSSAPMKQSEAHDGSAKARIGYHNDCFLGSDSDFGTYNDYGPETSGSDTAVLKSYKAEDSRFLAVGGETCNSSGYSPYDECESAGGRADSELRALHYSYLNSEYNNAVNNDWVNQGCMDDIKRNLGYRFVLLEGDYSEESKPGSAVSIKIRLKNVGYAPVFNPRDVELVLREATQKQTYRVKLAGVDPRFWESDVEHTIAANPCLPDDMLPGSYDLFIHLPDPEPAIRNRWEYAIRLANEGVWDATTGYNSLLHQIEVSSDAAGNVCDGNLEFELLSQN